MLREIERADEEGVSCVASATCRGACPGAVKGGWKMGGNGPRQQGQRFWCWAEGWGGVHVSAVDDAVGLY